MNIIFMFALMPRIGIISVPIALTISRIVTYFTLYQISKKKGVIILPNGVLLLLIISVLICYFIIYMECLIVRYYLNS